MSGNERGQVTNICKYCEMGAYSESPRVSECFTCPNGATSPLGSSSLLQCSGVCGAGRFASSDEAGHVCLMCPRGKYKDGRTHINYSNCSSCPAGKYNGMPGEPCIDCPAGQYSATTGSFVCLECGQGKFSGIGSSLCECPCDDPPV